MVSQAHLRVSHIGDITRGGVMNPNQGPGTVLKNGFKDWLQRQDFSVGLGQYFVNLFE